MLRHVLLVLMCLVMAGVAPAADVTVRVTDAPGGAGLAEVKVEAWVGGQKHAEWTDKSGVVVLPVPETAEFVLIHAEAPGRVPSRVQWRPVAGDRRAAVELPLPAGVPVGGRVVNTEGAPLPEAMVFLSWNRGGENPGPQFNNVMVRADAAGVWTADFVPAETDGLRIRVQHPDAAPRGFGGISIGAGGLQPEALHTGSAELRMLAGVRVHGRVTAEDGTPLAGAAVHVGHSRFSGGKVASRTDAEGRFSQRVSVGSFQVTNELAVTVRAAGLGPGLATVDRTQPAAEGDAVDVGVIELEPGRTLRGEVVDADGAPLEGVRVIANTWRGLRTLEWEAHTDSEGRFVWDEAPADEVAFTLLSRAKMMDRSAAMTAGDAVNRVVLLDPLVIEGAVTDAATGEPIEDFTVYAGRTWREDTEPRFDDRETRSFRAGRYGFPFTEPGGMKYVAVEAPGYTRSVSPAFDPQGAARRHTFDVALRPAAGLSGRVVNAGGTPVAGAQVEIIHPNLWPDLTNGRRRGRPTAGDAATTDAAGTFWLGKPKGDYLLLVLHERGIARTSSQAFRQSGEVRLEPWARIEGVVWDGTAPAANAVVRGNTFSAGYKSGRATIEVDYRAVADGEGRFVIDRVTPGKMILGREVHDVENGSSSTVSNARPTLVAGEVRQLKIGGIGRAVRGRITRPADLPQPPAGTRWELAVQLHPQRAAAKATLGDRRLSDALGPDGAFVFDDVPAGEYEMTYEFGETRRGWFSREPRPYFRVSHRVVVPEMPGGVSDEPLELGEITGEPLRGNWPAVE